MYRDMPTFVFNYSFTRGKYITITNDTDDIVICTLTFLEFWLVYRISTEILSHKINLVSRLSKNYILSFLETFLLQAKLKRELP